MNSIHRHALLRKTSLKSLQAFEAAYLHGSFTAAAADLCVTASAISHAVQSLEHSLGAALFERRKRAIVPTEAGNRLYRVLNVAFTDIDEEMRAIAERGGGRQAVTVQSSPSFAAIWMMPRLPAFLREHPDIDLRLSALHEPIDFQHTGLDLAIVYGKLPQLPNLFTEVLSPRERYVPLCPPALVAGRSLPLPPEALRDFQLVHNEASMVSWSDWVNRFVPVPCDARKGLRFDRSFMMANAVIDGLGMCLESTLLAHDYLRRGDLIMPFGDLAIPAVAHCLCIPRARLALRSVQVIRTWIKGWLPAEAAPL